MTFTRSMAGLVMLPLYLWLAASPAWSADPPADLVKRVAAREAESETARGNYLYRQTVTINDLDTRGMPAGEYREVRDIIFSPKGERTEQAVGRTVQNLKNLKLTEEDFRDIRDVQPLLLTPDRLWIYETRYKGEETVDDVPCWVLQIRPRQILDGQRLFDGALWIHQTEFAVVRMEGRAVPQMFSNREGKENLFPRFTTVRAKVGEHWFPIRTFADDTLPFRTGPLGIKMVIRYSNYQKFQSDSTITFK